MRYLLFFAFFILLSGCNKEKQINKNLSGKWTVSRNDTFWTNGSNSAPSIISQSNYATIEFDKNGKGQMIIPAGVYYYNGDPIYYEGEIYEVEYLKEDQEQVIFNGPVYTFTCNLKWGWDKESITLSEGGMKYTDNSSYYSELEFHCEKED